MSEIDSQAVGSATPAAAVSDGGSWLICELVSFDDKGDAEPDFGNELRRVGGLLGRDPAWANWWSRQGGAPKLCLSLYFVRARMDGFGKNAIEGVLGKERINRSKNREHLHFYLSPAVLQTVVPELRGLLAAAVFRQMLERYRELRGLQEPLPLPPPEIHAAPLSQGVRRRLRLHALRSGAQVAVPDWFGEDYLRSPGREGPAVQEPGRVTKGSSQVEGRPAGSPKSEGPEKVLQVHVPMGTAVAETGRPRWIDVIEDYCKGEELLGNLRLREAEERGEDYVFELHGYMSSTADAAVEILALPGLPPGAWVAVTSETTEPRDSDVEVSRSGGST